MLRQRSQMRWFRVMTRTLFTGSLQSSNLDRLQRATCLMILVVWLAIIACLIIGCYRYVEVLKEADYSNKIPFISDGGTTRSEISQRLGEPKSSYKSGKILIYEIKLNSEKRNVYDLVLVFDDNDILSRHSVVRVK